MCKFCGSSETPCKCLDLENSEKADAIQTITEEQFFKMMEEHGKEILDALSNEEMTVEEAEKLFDSFETVN